MKMNYGDMMLPINRAELNDIQIALLDIRAALQSGVFATGLTQERCEMLVRSLIDKEVEWKIEQSEWGMMVGEF